MATEIFHVTLFVLAFWHSTRAVVVSANLSSVWQPDERIITLPESLLAEDIPDYVPPSVKCVKKKLCDEHKICATVCERGTVEVDTWLANALKTQRQLAYQHSLCETQLPSSHNSAITIADGYGIEDQVYDRVLRVIEWVDKSAHVRTNDQVLSLTDQLNLGLRMLELDTHWVEGELRIAHCGGAKLKPINGFIKLLNKLVKKLGKDIEWDTETIGCAPSASSIPVKEQRSLESAFEEIALWRAKTSNQDEFLVLYFDCQVDLKEWHKVTTLTNTILKHFNSSEIFTPEDQKKLGWPPLSTLIQSKKTVMFVSSSDLGLEMRSMIFHRPEVCHWREPNLPLKAFPTCEFRAGEKSNEGSLLRPTSSEIQFGPFNSDAKWGENTGLLTEETLPNVSRCAVNFPSPDTITPRRLEATVWSWAEGHGTNCQTLLNALKSPEGKAGSEIPIEDESTVRGNYNTSVCIQVSREDGRWRTANAGESWFLACRSQTNNVATGNAVSGVATVNMSSSSSIREGMSESPPIWRFGRAGECPFKHSDSSKGTQSATMLCPEGTKFSAPSNAYENALLQARMHELSLGNVWINVACESDEDYGIHASKGPSIDAF